MRAIVAVSLVAVLYHAPVFATESAWVRRAHVEDKDNTLVNFQVYHKLHPDLAKEVHAHSKNVWDQHSDKFQAKFDHSHPKWTPHGHKAHKWLSQGGLEEHCEQEWDRHTCTEVPVRKVESHFKVKMAHHEHKITGHRRVQAESEPVLDSSVAFVFGLTPGDDQDDAFYVLPVSTQGAEDRRYASSLIAQHKDRSKPFEGVSKRRAGQSRGISAARRVSPITNPLQEASNCTWPSDILFMEAFVGDQRIAGATIAVQCEEGGYWRDGMVGPCTLPTSLTVNVRYSTEPSTIRYTVTRPLSSGDAYPLGSWYNCPANSDVMLIDVWFSWTPPQPNRLYISGFVTFPSTVSRPEVYYATTYLGGPLTTPIGIVPKVDETPSVIRSQYGINDAYCSDIDTAPKIGVIAMDLNQSGWIESDLQTYAETWIGVSLDFSRQLITLGDCSGTPVVETTIDLQMTFAICPKATVVVSCMRNTLSGYLDHLQNEVLNPSGVLSWGLSYSTCEDTRYSEVYARMDLYQGIMAANGVPTFSGSGDRGSQCGGRAPVAEMNNGFVNMISVGSTAFLGVTEEVSMTLDQSLTTSGGGYSVTTPIPEYQSLWGHSTSTMRGYPDISFVGTRIFGVIGDTLLYFEGTSVSTPVAAAFFARATLAAGLTSLPGLHYLLYNKTRISMYASASIFNDVVNGNNCAAMSPTYFFPTLFIYPDTHCYQAGPGWDAASGLGSVRYPAFINYLMALNNIPSPVPTPVPTAVPTREPTRRPTRVPTPKPTPKPTPRPTSKPAVRRFDDGQSGLM